MKVIVGLGNPGKKYQGNRHNVGHLFIDKSSKGRDQKIARFVASERKSQNSKLFKTTVFMNESGREVKKLINNYQLSISNLLIVHDDMDLPLGKFKLQFGRSSAGHKGVQSIIEALGTQDFWRLRIGIGKPPEGIEGDAYVLSDFSDEEQGIIEKVFEEAREKLLEFIRNEKS